MRRVYLYVFALIFTVFVVSWLVPVVQRFSSRGILVLNNGYTTGFVGYAASSSRLYVEPLCGNASLLVVIISNDTNVSRIVRCNVTLSVDEVSGPFIVYVRVVSVSPTSLGSRGVVKAWLRQNPWP